ncbi:MAG: hypothetical protein HY290_03010 [Planctomycetia bacterium]|nr:hypothetical protein [Planctomycetia bacterium]
MDHNWDYFSRLSGKNPTNAYQRLKDAQAAARARRYDVALEGYIWFHENSVDEPSMAGVRLSFALMYWIELGKVYPPARTALEEVRDRKTKSLLNGFRDFQSFLDVVSINKHLGSERATYDLFVSLNSSSPQLAQVYADLALPALIAVEDFVLARQFMPDPTEEIEKLAKLFRATSSHVDLETSVHLFADRLMVLVQILRGIGDFVKADEVIAAASEAFESPEARDAFRAAIADSHGASG